MSRDIVFSQSNILVIPTGGGDIPFSDLVSNIQDRPQDRKEQFTILLDLDGTLKSEHSNHGSMSFERKGKTYSFDPRPGCKDFVKELSAIAPVVICTLSGHGYATEVLKMTGVSKYVSGLICKNDLVFGVIPQLQKYVLIDDIPELAAFKMERINHFSRKTEFVLNQNCWFLQIAQYPGGREEESPYPNIINQVKMVYSEATK